MQIESKERLLRIPTSVFGHREALVVALASAHGDLAGFVMLVWGALTMALGSIPGYGADCGCAGVLPEER
jgi:hypothetical protein